MPKTVLIVDDHEDVARISARILTAQGYRVLIAGDGTRALELATADRPDCILLDIMMPAMSGLQVLARLKQDSVTAAIPVILVTAKVRDEDVLCGYKEGADYYITKPFSAQQLVYGVRLVLGLNTPTAPRPTSD